MVNRCPRAKLAGSSGVTHSGEPEGERNSPPANLRRVAGKLAGCPAFLPVGRGGEESRPSNDFYLTRKFRPGDGSFTAEAVKR